MSNIAMQKALTVLAAVLVVLTSPVLAQDALWPTQTVRLVAAAGPGGNPDVMARLLADKFTAAFGKPFIVENMPGAGGIVAANMVAKTPPESVDRSSDECS